ncbi:cobalamin B12-binding domain-containing protein [Betaproteobacteria bacterium]|nr:cobalamin B12-binding domain-containing protein [Betaproteobacteria bacterium]
MITKGFATTIKKDFMGKKEKEGPRRKKVISAPIPSTIHEEIIPRLLMAHRQKADIIKKTGFENGCNIPAITAGNVEELSHMMVNEELSVSKSYLRILIEEGISIEQIYLDLLQPTARRLGICWENDSLDFATITLAVWHINQLMYYLSPELLQNTVDHGKSKGRILLFPSLGSQHTLGLFMLSEFFRKSGWEVFADPALSEQDIFNTIEKKDFQVVGISIGSYDQKESTKKLICDIRRMYGSALKIIIGGPLAFCENNLFREVEADGQAADAREAVLLANSLVRKKNIPVKP